jgi:type III pantothenate kinase
VPQSIFNLRNLSRRYFNVEPLVIGENAKLGVDVRIDKPSEAGADRLVNAVGAHMVYPGPLIVIDSGTATTFDIVAADGAFEGGIIAPGINLSMQALHEAAAKLPRIAIQRPARNRVVGHRHRQRHAVGRVLGLYLPDRGPGGPHQGRAGRTHDRGRHRRRRLAVRGATDSIDHFDSDLTIRGLLEIHRRNTHLET